MIQGQARKGAVRALAGHWPRLAYRAIELNICGRLSAGQLIKLEQCSNRATVESLVQ